MIQRFKIWLYNFKFKHCVRFHAEELDYGCGPYDKFCDGFIQSGYWEFCVLGRTFFVDATEWELEYMSDVDADFVYDLIYNSYY